MKDDFKRNLKIIIFVNLLVKILGLFYRFFIARALKIEGMTILALLSPTLSLALCLSNFSLPNVINQKVSHNSTNKTYSNRATILSSLKITIITSSIISILILLFGSFLSQKIITNNSLYYPLLFTIPLIYISNFSGVFKGYLEAHKYFKTTAISNLLEQVIKIILCVFLVILFNDKGVVYSVCAAITGMILSEIASFTFLLIKVSRLTKLNYKNVETNYKEILVVATPLTINHLIFSLVSFIEPILFTLSLSLINIDKMESIEYFALVTSYAFTLLTMAFFATFSVTKTIFPYISSNKFNNKRNILLIKKSLVFSFVVGLVNFNLTYFYPDVLLKLLYDNQMATDIVKMLSPFYLIYYFSPIYVTALQALGHEKKLLKNNIISHVIELLLIFILCTNTHFTFSGILLSIGTCFLISHLLHYLTLKKVIGFKLGFTFIFNFLLITALNIILTLILQKYLNMYIVMIIPNIITSLIIYYCYKKLDTKTTTP